MVLDKHIPEDADSDGERVLSRLPNYCPTCGEELVIAGGHIQAQDGWYPHLDTEVVCSGPDMCNRYRFTAGVEDGGEVGREFRVAPGASDWSDHFSDYHGWCSIHWARMGAAKDLVVDGRPARQYKCDECDRETVVRLD